MFTQFSNFLSKSKAEYSHIVHQSLHMVRQFRHHLLYNNNGHQIVAILQPTTSSLHSRSYHNYNNTVLLL